MKSKSSKNKFSKVKGFIGGVGTIGSKACKSIVSPKPNAKPLRWHYRRKNKSHNHRTTADSATSDNVGEMTDNRELLKQSIKNTEVSPSTSDSSGSSTNRQDVTSTKPMKLDVPSEIDAETTLYENEKKSLIHEYWYHGLMPRDEIEAMLKEDGDFLVRETEVAHKNRFAISVFSNGRIRHILINHLGGKWLVGSVRKTSIVDLIEHFVTNREAVHVEGTVLINGVKRPPYYILHDHIIIGKRLGGGAFGDVHIGVWKKSDKEEVKVAIKKFKGAMSKKERSEFVREASIMRKFHHPNIVGVLGVAAQKHPLLILMDLAPNGALNSYLKKHPETSVDRLVGFIVDATRGMCYLSASRVIHRDVAARNCLLGSNYEVKISDFGLSVSNTENIKVDRLKNVPVRWLAPETLRQGIFSAKSDAWSFGVLIWEVFSYCKTDPFPGLSNAQARTKILSGNEPMQPPDGTPPTVCTAMHNCFIQNAAKRTNFEELLQLLSPMEQPPKAATSLTNQTATETPLNKVTHEEVISTKVDESRARKDDWNEANEVRPDGRNEHKRMTGSPVTESLVSSDKRKKRENDLSPVVNKESLQERNSEKNASRSKESKKCDEQESDKEYDKPADDDRQNVMMIDPEIIDGTNQLEETASDGALEDIDAPTPQESEVDFGPNGASVCGTSGADDSPMVNADEKRHDTNGLATFDLQLSKDHYETTNRKHTQNTTGENVFRKASQ